MTNRDEIEELKRRVKVLEELVKVIERTRKTTNYPYPEPLPFPYDKPIPRRRRGMWPDYNEEWEWRRTITNPNT